ncbi:type I restriction system specificity protein [Phytohabitans rumicis]|uniref:Type I restriction system specificity protein n=1 Tax=Phytohabitans rumicis TaxID=1076125 RepID=A0A6V8LBT9_9ACTN|nr:type I restriction system specificity protein [Phytohabitans rumicis]
MVGRATNLGKPTWSDTDYWPLNTTLYVADFKGNDPQFLYHLFETLDLTGFDSGSVQPMLNRNYIAGIEVRIPDLRTQRAIAEILRALDDKVVTNDRAGKLAVSLTEAEFAQATSSVVAGTVAFEDVAEIGGGATPKTSIDGYWNGDIRWATPTDVTALRVPYLSQTSRTITESGLASCSSRLYPAGAILMTSRATIGAFAVARVPLAVNQGFIVVNARDEINQWWLFHEMRARVDEFLSHANGATFLELPRGRFKKLELRMPTVEQARAFGSKVGPLHDMAAQLMAETAALGATRNELLPLLMSGRIRVRDAEKVMEEVV